MSRLIEINELREERGGVLKQAADVLTAAHKAEGELRGAKMEEWRKLHAKGDELAETIEAFETQRAAEASLEAVELANPAAAARASGRLPNLAGGDPISAEIRESVFRKFALGSENCASREAASLPTEEELAAAKSMRVDFAGNTGKQFIVMAREQPRTIAACEAAYADLERRAPQTTSAGTGGDFIPEGFWPRYESALLSWGGMRNVAEVLRTNRGNALPMPTDDDTSQKGAIIAESTAAGEQVIATDVVTLGAFKYTSLVVLVPMELIEDSAFPIGPWVAEKLGTRIGRIHNEHFTTGTGSGQPRGITVAAATVAAAGAAAITRTDMLNLKHGVNSAYRGMAKYMFADTTLLALKLLVDSQSRPLWMGGVREGEPDTFDGDRYVINDEMPAIGTGNRSVTYGDHSKYKIRDVRGMRLTVMRERYAEKDQVGFAAWHRADGDLLDAGTNPVKALLHP